MIFLLLARIKNCNYKDFIIEKASFSALKNIPINWFYSGAV